MSIFTPLEHPDFRGQDTMEYKLSREALQNYQAACQQFLQAQSKRRRPMPKLMQKRLANKWSLCATDGSMRASVGQGLSVLMDDQNPARALHDGESRFHVPVAKLPLQLRQIAALGQLLQLRDKKKADKFMQTLTSSMTSLLEEAVDNQEMAAIENEAKNSKAVAKIRHTNADAMPSNMQPDQVHWAQPDEYAGPSEPTATAALNQHQDPLKPPTQPPTTEAHPLQPPQGKPELPKGWDINDARALLPQTPGSQLSFHTDRAWLVKYSQRTTAGHKSHQCKFHDEKSKEEALWQVMA